MHPRKMQNPNRGKRHAARLPQRERKLEVTEVRVSYRAPQLRAGLIPYTAS